MGDVAPVTSHALQSSALFSYAALGRCESHGKELLALVDGLPRGDVDEARSS